MTKRYVWSALGLALLAAGAARAADPEQETRKELESARTAVSQWVQAQHLLAKEARDWQQAKELMESRIDLLGGELAALESKLAETRKALSDAGQKRDDVEGKKEDLLRRAAELETTAAELETSVRALNPRLPAPLQQRLAPLYERMPSPGSTRPVALAERFQNVLGILNEVNKANAEIAVVSEVRTLSDGKPSEVRTVYLGLGQAYYLSAGGEAGVGRPGPNGWSFTPDNSLKENVLQVLEILMNKSTPHFVPIPVRID